MIPKIEVKCKCGHLRRLNLDCKEFTCLCGITYVRSGPPPGDWKAKKKPKYNNKIVKLDGFTFDSQLEADYYVYLKQQKAAGIVIRFKLQPHYVLLEGRTRNERVEYVADFFVVYADGREEAQDTKSSATLTKSFRIKQKWFADKYPHLTLKIIMRENGIWTTDVELKAAEKLRKKAERKLLKRGG
jgi:hypothetical protein